MKKLLFISLLFLVSQSHAAWVESFNMADSCYTATNQGPIVIPNTPPGTVLLGVVVASTSSTLGTLKIYDSSGVASGQLANIDLGRNGDYTFEVRLSSGLTYTTANNTGGITLIFKRLRP